MKMGRSGRWNGSGRASSAVAPEKESQRVMNKSIGKARTGTVKITRKTKASPRDIAQVFIQPRDADIACGRGKGVTKRQGNQNYRRILQESRELYLAAKTINEKSSTIELCRGRLAETGRFIKFNKMNQCYEISAKQAHQKIGQVSAGGIEKNVLLSTVS
jgi:hypothetical protein